MYSTTTLTKNSKFTGRILGTHQQLDLAARRVLGKNLPHGRDFPAGKDIIYFEGSRGPDGLKRKSPGVDEPSHMLKTENAVVAGATESARVAGAKANNTGASGARADDTMTMTKSDLADDDTSPLGPSPTSVDHGSLDTRSVLTLILDHRWNLVRALRAKDNVRAAFEAAWMAHMIADGLTPAHHFPLSEVKEELMTDKEMVRLFGTPIKGVMHGRSLLETMRNNWLYWGARGHMTQHIAYEYGVLMIAAATPSRRLPIRWDKTEFSDVNIATTFEESVRTVRAWKMYERFRKDGWTTDLALETRDLLLPEIIRCIALGWYSAAEEAYRLPKGKENKKKHD